MKSVLLSTQPKWCEKICHEIGKDENGKPIYEKAIEVRKGKPSEVPFKAFIYETKGATETPWADEDGHLIFKGRGQVIGEFICDKLDKFNLPYPAYFCEVPQEVKDLIKGACLTMTEVHHYIGQNAGYAWHISDLKIYDKPRELSEFISASERCKVGYSKCNKIVCGLYPCSCMTITRAPQSWQYVEELK